MKKITVLFSLALGLFSMSKADAQAGAYAFAASSGSFTPITGGTDVNSIEADDAVSPSIPIGFTFNFDGVDYTDVVACSNGFISFASGASSSTTNDLDNTSAVRRPLLAPLWDDLDGSATGGSTAAYVVTGTAPNRVFTFEFLNWEWRFGSSDPVVSFQVKLYETTNVVEYVYRSETGTPNTPSASIGISGVSTFLSLDGTGATPNASNTTETTSLSTVPADGQVYSFTPPSCPAPTALAASNVSSTGADIGWTTGGAANWNLEYGPAGFTPGSGTLMTNVTNPLSLSMLTANTDYDVYVQDSCGAGDVSAWSSVSFTTPCGTYTPVYTESFSSFVPTCWEEAGDGTPSAGPSSLGTGKWTSDGFLNSGTTGAARIEMWLTGDKEWLISPEFDLSGMTAWELSFDVGVTTYSGSNSATLDSDDEIILLISEDNGTTWDTLEIFNATNSPSNTGETRLYNLSSYTSSAKFAFWANEGATYGGVDLNFYLDNFDIHQLPACPAPTALAASNVSSTGADISWTTGGAANWNLEYGPAGFTPGTGTMVVNTAKPYNITGLTAGTSYDVYVQDSCGVGAVSNWTSLSFTTAYGPHPFPLMEDFEDNTLFFENESSSDVAWALSTTLAHGGTQSMHNAYSASDENILHETGILDLSVATTPVIEFWHIAKTEGTYDECYVQISTDGGATYTNLPSSAYTGSGAYSTYFHEDSYADWGTGTETPDNSWWKKESFDLSAYNVANVRFRFVLESDGSGQRDGWYIDDIHIFEPACADPSNLTVTGLTDTVAVLGWTTGGATNWNVEFGPAGFTPGTGYLITNAFNPLTIDTLSPNTAYEFYVQDSCAVGNVSNWVGPFGFQTNIETCNSLQPVTLPFVEDFETINDSIVGTGNVYCGTDKAWAFYTDDNAFGRLTIGTFAPENNGGNGAAFLDVHTSGSVVANELVLTLDMSNYTLTDNVFLSFDFADWGDENHSGDRVWVRGSDTDSWIEVYDWSGRVTNNWLSVDQGVFVAEVLGDNSQMFSTTFQVKFGQEDNYPYNSDGLGIDNIKLEIISCPRPTDLAEVYQSQDSVVINWNAGAIETSWDIEYGEIGFTQGSGTMVVAADTIDTIAGLNLGAVYEFYVRANCGGGDESDWVGPLFVATPVLNDTTCDAIFVAPNTDFSARVFSNIGATLQANESALPGSQYNTVWFKTVIPTSGHLLIATCGSDFNSVVGAYAHDTIICDSMETFGQIAYNSSNFSVCGQSSRGSVEICGATAGDTVMFYVGGSSSTQSGLINLIVSDYSLDGYAGEGPATPLSVCAGDTVDLWSNLTGQLTNLGDWEYPSNSSAIVDDTTVNTGAFSLTGNEVYYIVSNTCDADTATVAINAATQTNTGSAISNFQACSNGDVFLFDGLTGTVDAGGVWNDNTGTGLLNGNRFIADGLPNGPYQFTYVVDNGICPVASTQITVNLVDCTNITEGEATTFGVYPNPNDGTFFITNGKNESNIVMEVIDVQGKVIYSNTYVMAAGAQQEVSLGNVESGVYLVRVVTNNQVFNSNVIVK
ncbi:MAG: T9SS type A sorting domain-containing protein [Flavobacteriales bacterium]|jgi:hypothetical protein|nr:T9SS type A sorting domain-containing protein [Flavobacteriales bacterium]